MNKPKNYFGNIPFTIQLVLIIFLGIFLFFPDKLNLQFKSIEGNIYDFLIVRRAKALIWVVVIFNLIYLYVRLFLRRKVREIYSGIALSILTVLITLIVLEIGFMFFAQTHGVATTKASVLWVDKYYKPMNSLGFRDKEPVAKKDKKAIFFVGDSFTAGYGNDFVEDRFSNMFDTYLDSSKYIVYNLGIPGIDTKREFELLEEYPIKPDIIILAYFFNDIEVAAQEHGYTLGVPEPYAGLPKLLNILVRYFYLPNFIYWHLPGGESGLLDEFLNKTYKNPEILQTHLNDVARIIDFSTENGAELAILNIPFLPDLAYSDQFTKTVSEYLKENNVLEIRVEEELESIKPMERTVNKTDSHSSIRANEIMAKKIYKTLKEKSWIE